MRYPFSPKRCKKGSRSEGLLAGTREEPRAPYRKRWGIGVPCFSSGRKNAAPSPGGAVRKHHSPAERLRTAAAALIKNLGKRGGSDY